MVSQAIVLQLSRPVRRRLRCLSYETWQKWCFGVVDRVASGEW